MGLRGAKRWGGVEVLNSSSVEGGKPQSDEEQFLWSETLTPLDAMIFKNRFQGHSFFFERLALLHCNSN